MTHLSLQLRSENPPFGSDFRLAPGSQVRVGSSPKAEITIPFPGIADVSLIIGRSGNGLLYVSQPDGSGVRYIEPPAIVSVAPYHFVVTESASQRVSTPSQPTSGRRRGAKKHSPWTIIAGSIAALLFVGFVFAELRNSPKSETSQTAPASAKLPEPPVESLEKKAIEPAPLPAPETPKPVVVTPAPEPAPEIAKALDLEELAEKAAASVFTVRIKIGDSSAGGTAFAISADGLLATNYHVIEDAHSISVSGTNGKVIPVERVVAVNPKADLALLSLATPTPDFLELGNSSETKVGAPVAVYGAPQGLSGTLSTGIVSAKRTNSQIGAEEIDRNIEFIQITAPISPGSSGSPVMDRHGKVIGVATLASKSTELQNVNFAIPSAALIKLREDAAKGLANVSPSIVTPSSKASPKKSATTEDIEDTVYKDKDMQEFERLMQMEDYVAAMIRATSLVARYPGSATAHLAQGTALLGADLPEQAETSFTKALKLAPNDPTIWYFYGLSQMSQQKFQEARRSIKRAVGLKPGDAAAWKELASLAIALNDAPDAISSLQRVRELNRPMFDKWITLYSNIKEPSLALKTLLSHYGVRSSGESSDQTEFHDIVIGLISEYLSSQEQVDPLAELAHFSEVVNPYYEKGRRSKSEIIPHIKAFRAQWPQRRFEFIRLEQADFLNGFNLEVTYVVRFTTISDRDQRSGLMRQTLHFTEDGNRRWRISAIKTHSN